MQPKLPNQTIKLSFRLLLFGFVLIFALGVVGGFVGQYVGKPSTEINLPSSNGQNFVTNVQQVTVSPNKNAAQLIENVQRSIFLIQSSSTNSASSSTGIGVVLTNDGLIATTATLTGDAFIAIDSSGSSQAVSKVGADELYGITYFRLNSAVTVPIDVSSSEAAVSTQLLAISRSNESGATAAYPFFVTHYATPGEQAPPAIQRILKNFSPSGAILPGTPLITDDGKLSGQVLDGSGENALRASDIKESLDRFVSNKREYNPFTAIGIIPKYVFIDGTTTGQKEFVAVAGQVTPNSPAALAGIKPQDRITKVGDENVSWIKNISGQISAALPLTMTVVRQGQAREVTLNATPTPLP